MSGTNNKNLAEFIRYVFGSATALLVDYGCYWLLANNNMLSIPQAAVVGYTAGLVVAYFFIANRVFEDGWLKEKKHFELILFGVSGLFGILLTYLTVKSFTLVFGNHVQLAKLSAVAVSFVGVYFFRKYIVFRRSDADAPAYDPLMDPEG